MFQTTNQNKQGLVYVPIEHRPTTFWTSSPTILKTGHLPRSDTQQSILCVHRITIFNLKFSMGIYDISYDISMAPTDYIKLL